MKQRKWYQTQWFTILMLIFVFPVGLFLMWKYQPWGKWIKIIVTVVVLIMFMINFPNNKQPQDSHSTKQETTQEHTNKEEHKKQTSKHKDEKNEAKKEKEEKESYEPGTTDRIPVKLSAAVDGDTAKFVYNNKTETFRFLLIDTPETKHPRLGKQPFGQEASDRTAELLRNAKKIEVEFDVGQKQDKYHRYLAYIYVDGKMLNDILVKEGLARVAYVYPPNTRYLSELEASQEKAREEKLGIWSLTSAFEEESHEQPAATTAPAQNDNTAQPAPQQSHTEPAQSTQSFANCTQLRSVYPNGVPQGHPAYQPKLDRDNDNFACER